MMDDDFAYGVDEVMESIDKAKVLSVFFPRLRRALVIDTRRNETTGPMVRLMQMVASPQERLRSIRRLRPGFPRLRSLTLIPWARYVDSLVELGVWERLMQRLRDSGSEEGVLACDAVLDELRRLEKAELGAVVLGKNYHTIWSARG